MDPTTSTTQSQTKLSLRAWPSKSSTAPPLSTLIERITTQRGSFRNVTEQSLGEEVVAQEAGKQIHGDSSESEDGEEEKSAKEQLYEARTELLKFASQAFNESAQTLDFLSLLLSKSAPKQAELTLSPYVKSHVPMGSLGAEVLETSEPNEQQDERNSLVSTGWKLQSLSSSADSLLRAASNLEKEMEKETKYWEQVLAVKDKGWSVCRMPRERHTLAVRYGFLEAAPEFRDRGLAAMRRDEDGSIDLDLGVSSSPQSISVQIRKANSVVATSRREDAFAEGDRSAEKSILQARNNLFDEELFHEMYREARGMTNRGVKCIKNGISVPLHSDLSMFIDLEDTGRVPSSVSDSTGKHAQHAQLAVTALRILLAHSHRQNYLRRTKLQPPLTEKRPQRPIPAILRPIVSHFEHRSSLQSIEAYINNLEKTLKKAGLEIKCQKPESNLKISQLLTSNSSSDDARSVDTLTNALLSPLNSSLKFHVGTEDVAFTVTVRTHFMGTDYKFAANSTDSGTFLTQVPPEMSFSTELELRNHICHMAMLWLVDLVETRRDKWMATSPDEGELTTQETLDGDYEILHVVLNTEELRLKWLSTYEDGQERVAIWMREGMEESITSFLSKVDEFSEIIAPS